jgi:ATP/maltotriose-dependent transcriptional regulator MalT
VVGWNFPDYRGEELVLEPGSPTWPAQVERSAPRTGSVVGLGKATDPDRPSGRSRDASTPDSLWRCRTRQNLTGASLPQIRRGLARAWRLVLAQQMAEAFGAIDRIERQLDDVPPPIAARLHAATQLVRAVGLAFQDDSRAALENALSIVRESGASPDDHVIATLCRLGYWHLGELEAFHALPRQQPRLRWSRSHAVSAMVDLSIEAAVALDHLQVSTAKRLASDALTIAAATKAPPGLAAIPACIAAQLLYEEGHLDEACTILRDRLPAINAEGSIECALRAYRLLGRVARLRGQYDHAAIVLREAAVLAERRGWPRLVAACALERISLLLDAGRTREARLGVEILDRYADAHHAGFGHSRTEFMRYSTLAHCRVSWAEAPSREAAAAFRRLYHRTVDRRSLYAGCRLAVELAGMLASIGETEEADALFFHAIKSGAGAGLHQIFLERGEESGLLLQRAYDRAEAPGSADRETLPLIGSLLSRWTAQQATGRPEARISDVLTERERAILYRISQGMANKQIARVLQISPETVKSHIKRIFLKLAVGTRAEAVSHANSLGLL